jgi:hypothetical protein
MERIYQYYFVYKTTFKPTGEFYIGKHHADHLNDKYLGSGKKLKILLNVHPVECFEREILEFCSSPKLLKLKERQIVNPELLKNPLCLNLVKGGGGGQGPLSKETKQKIGDANRGRIHTEETKRKNSESHKGMKLSTETKQKMSLSHVGIQTFGFKVTEKTKEKISSSMKGLIRSEETKTKMAQAAVIRESKKKQQGYQTRKPLSEETKRKISETLKNKKLTNGILK